MKPWCLMRDGLPCADVARCDALGCRPVQYGPARYRIVYADGYCGYERTLSSVIHMLVRRRTRWTWPTWPHGEPVRVEPVPGTQYRGTWGGQTFGWRNDVGMADYAAAAGHHTASVLRLTALELRSPVQS